MDQKALGSAAHYKYKTSNNINGVAGVKDMQDKRNKVVIVLGMHRSGTSAVTRALEVLGINLGNCLLPAAYGINDKGFFEDVDINALNIDLLHAFDRDWYTLTPVGEDYLDVEKIASFRARAMRLLREKTATPVDVFAIKDPRICLLLPFWQDVLQRLDMDASYVICLRHPLSVASSLHKRDGFAVEKSCYLWLEYLLPSLVLTANSPRLVVDYDCLLDAPGTEIRRIAQVLGREPALDARKLQQFETEFLEQGLRHSRFQYRDLQDDPAVPGIVLELYRVMLEVAGGALPIDAAAVQGSLERASAHLREISPALRYMTRQDGALAQFRLAQDEHVGEIAELRFTLDGRNDEIAYLKQELDERAGEITGFRFALDGRSDEIASLKQMLAERAGSIAHLERILADRDAWIHMLVTSISWRITKPVRWLGRLLRGEFLAALDPFRRLLGAHLGADASPGVARKAAHSPQPDFQFLPLAPMTPTHPVAVILPIYRDAEMSRRCILAALPGVIAVPGARLLAINDASPDSGMQAMLDEMANRWPDVFVALRNEENQGFVRTVNRGLEYFAQHDAVLLNSDVIVPQDWLQRLRDEAYSGPNVGTVTPLSNNATICSFPCFLQENPPPFGLDADGVDAVFRHFRLPCIEAPTGVGFCMYVRWACIEQTGLLDAKRFGRGYGEENDLCQRALKQGWRNLITPNLYAFHQGGMSFSSDKHALVERAMRVIDELHPNYHADVQAFVRADPLKPARVARYVQLLSTLELPKVLHVSHDLGGGIGQHLDELAEYLGRRAACLLLTSQGDEGTFNIRLGLDRHADQLLFRQQDYPAMLSLLAAAGVTAVHFHHTLGLHSLVHRLPGDLGVRHVMTVHDYYWLNANPTLTDESGVFPGYYSDELNNPLYPLPPGYTPHTWRDNLRPLIEGADCVIFPSGAAKYLFDGHYLIGRAVVAPHVEARRDVTVPVRAFHEKKNYTIGILGAVGREKGADYLEQIALKAKRMGKPYSFRLIGYAYKPLQAVDTIGPYRAQELAALIEQQQCDLIFFPALWPETYSYTLSYALESGLPIVAPDIGAFSERLSGRSNAVLYRPHMPETEFLDLLDGFIAALTAGKHISTPLWQGESPQQDFYAHAYIDMVGADVRVVEASDAKPVQGYQLYCHTRPVEGTLREALLHILWRFYMHPSMRWLGNRMPYGVRRTVKRLLSNRPMHDIARGRQ